MMESNVLFAGFGNSYGKYKITNKEIENAIDRGFLEGFSKEKISESRNYKSFCEENGYLSEFDYFTKEVMGFSERHHVTPFPPTKKNLHYAETSLGLGVRAVDEALEDARVKPSDIDAWFVSTVSPHEQAPGIAATIKSFFCDFSNQAPCFSLASGCSGFNINIERALEFFTCNPEAKHVMVAHTETMSSFLRQRIKFIPFVTFGDAAGAVVLSREYDKEKYGLLKVINLQDPKMLDYVGVDSKLNLYMDDKLIKDRAIVNIPHATKKCLELSSFSVDDIDLFVPHQTGNLILKSSAEKLGLGIEKLYLDGQRKFGNVSGATVPVCLSMLNKSNRFRDNMKIVSATAGVGGTYGAFSYIVKNSTENKKRDFYKYKDDLKNKSVLLLGASGSLGINITSELDKRGAKLILHGNNNVSLLKNFENADIYKADFSKEAETQAFIEKIINKYDKIDYVVNAVSTIDKSKATQVIFLSPVEIFKQIFPIVSNSILQLGTFTEDHAFYDYDEWTSSHRSIHGFLASASGELLKKDIRIVYYLSAFCDDGISTKFPEKERFRFMMSVGQLNYLCTKENAKRIVNSVYLPKIIDSRDEYENAMLVRRFGYKPEVDI